MVLFLGLLYASLAALFGPSEPRFHSPRGSLLYGLACLTRYESWFALPTSEYARESREFREAALEVADAGAKKDLDIASDAFAAMFKKCVQCHRYVGKVRDEPGRADSLK